MDAAADDIALAMAAQGQSIFWASGDWGAYMAGAGTPLNTTWITVVGGTELTTDGMNWVSETAWSYTGGGISTIAPIPLYQQGISMSTNGGSTTMRNLPDVSMVADYVAAVCNNGKWVYGAGTSISAPLWAGLTALANQAASLAGRPAIGCVNPLLYEIAKGSGYGSCLHDITSGYNIHCEGSNCYPVFYAVPGYDLCTGLGTPRGKRLLDTLVYYKGAIWVDYNYTGPTEDGSYDQPFKTLAAAAYAVGSGGDILFRTSGSKFERLTIGKPMSIGVTNGPVTVDGR